MIPFAFEGAFPDCLPVLRFRLLDFLLFPG